MSEEHVAGGDDAGGADDVEQLDDLADLDLDPEEPAELDEPTEATAPDGEPPPAPPPRTNRVQRQMREQIRRLNQRVREYEQREAQSRYAPPQPQPDPYREAERERLEAERVAQMMPHEQAQYYARQVEERVNAQILRARVEAGDVIDRQAFAQIQRDEPAARQMAGEVEELLRVARSQGQNPTREALFNQVYATRRREQDRREADQKRRAGRAAIARETVRPGSARSTAAAPRRNGAADDYDQVLERLRNTRLGDSGW